jgi:hypothetical protein
MQFGGHCRVILGEHHVVVHARCPTPGRAACRSCRFDRMLPCPRSGRTGDTTRGAMWKPGVAGTETPLARDHRTGRWLLVPTARAASGVSMDLDRSFHMQQRGGLPDAGCGSAARRILPSRRGNRCDGRSDRDGRWAVPPGLVAALRRERIETLEEVDAIRTRAIDSAMSASGISSTTRCGEWCP